tara:strand:- start:210 stop:542 length:333 start_codon:yes stop_codon:yes gene_type:complete
MDESQLVSDLLSSSGSLAPWAAAAWLWLRGRLKVQSQIAEDVAGIKKDREDDAKKRAAAREALFNRLAQQDVTMAATAEATNRNTMAIQSICGQLGIPGPLDSQITRPIN